MDKPEVLMMLLFFALVSCSDTKQKETIPFPDWSVKIAPVPVGDSLVSGSSYLPVYSQVYSKTEKQTFDLTVMVSLRNMNTSSAVYLTKIVYHDSEGQIIRDYLKSPIALLPLETTEIVINESDNSGSTGGNFLFDWQINASEQPPLFQAVMTSTKGQQGLSYITTGIHLKKQ